MKHSARNEFRGTVKSITRGPVTSLVKVDANGIVLSATITTEAVDEMGLSEGVQVMAMFKASAVIIGVE